MNQISVSLSTRLSLMSNGEFFTVSVSGYDGAVARVNDEYYLFQNHPRMDGSRPCTGEESELGFDNSWILDGYTINRTIEDLFLNLAESESVEITIKTPTGRCSTPVLLNDFVSKKYEEKYTYTGQHSYHHSHDIRWNKPLNDTKKYKIGVELEVEARNSTNHETITHFKSNWFTMERDGSLGSYGVEFITIPMNPCDIKDESLWRPFCERLSPIARSWDTGRCGLHVHIGREIMGDTAEKKSETLGKMLYLYHHFLKDSDINRQIYGRDRGYHDNDGRSESAKHVAALGSNILRLKDIRNKVDKELKDKSSRDRYFDINIQNSKTIEFRRGRGSINAERIVSVITYCEMIVNYSKFVSWTKISLEGFIAYCKKNVSKTSPLRKYFIPQEA